MDRIFIFALALAVCLATTASLRGGGHPAAANAGVPSEFVTDGAFRDGLYIGRMAAAEGKPQHPLVGRWSSEKDRASFLAGYLAGYGSLPRRQRQGEL